jgi:uncharacterized protein YndB with AHSA1/START domain
MTTPNPTPEPNVPLRLDLTFDLPGTPGQVWDAIATANGISAWFVPTDLEEREGGAVCFHMGEEMESSGSVTRWEPPRHLAYSEPDWAPMAGQEQAAVTPMVTEFLIEARSGGTCSLRVVSSAFGTGADWEQEFFSEMEKHWVPFFDNLRLYLTRFPGQRVTTLVAEAKAPGPVESVWKVLRDGVGVRKVGEAVEVNGLVGRAERIGTDINELLLAVDRPVPGYLLFGAYDVGDGVAHAGITGYLFSDEAPAYVERAQPGWKAWLDSLLVPTA